MNPINFNQPHQSNLWSWILLLLIILWALTGCNPEPVADGGLVTPTATAWLTDTPTLAAATAVTVTVGPTTEPAGSTPAVASPTPSPVPVTTEAPRPTPQRIQFEPGRTSIGLQSQLVPPETEHVYVFWAEAGQHASIDLDSVTGVANFALSGLADGQPYKQLANEDRIWQGTLPTTQDYLLRVVATEATIYALGLSIDPLTPVPDVPVITNTGNPPADTCVVVHPGGTAVVNVYDSPGQENALVARLGNWARVLSSENGWHQVEISPGHLGWVSQATADVLGPCLSYPTLTIHSDGASIRRGPGPHYAVVEEVSAGVSLFLVGRNSEHNTWWAVFLPGQDEPGWVPASQATVRADVKVSDLPLVPAEPVQIQFPGGATSASMHSRLASHEQHYYTFWAQAGQRTSVEVVSPNDVANFALTGMDDGQPLKRLVNEDRSWQGMLPASQNYLLTIAAADAATDYTVTLTIEPAATEEN